MKKVQQGFSLLEVVLVLTFLVIILGTGFMITSSPLNRANLDAAATGIVSSARRAQNLARGSNGDSDWGISAQPGSIVLFRGTSYAARDAAYDEIIDIASSLTLSGTTEFRFLTFSGLPSASGTITYSAPQGGASRNITINEKGTVLY